MKGSIEARKTLRAKNAIFHRVKKTNELCSRTQWFDNRVFRKATVQAEHKKAEAVTIISHPIRIR